MTVKWKIYPQDPPQLPTAGAINIKTINLICRGLDSCPSYGDRFSVALPMIAPGVLARPNFICADCFMELALDVDKEDNSVGS